MDKAIGSISFHPQFAKNRIDSSFRVSADGEVEHSPTPRDQTLVGYDPKLEPRDAGGRND